MVHYLKKYDCWTSFYLNSNKKIFKKGRNGNLTLKLLTSTFNNIWDMIWWYMIILLKNLMLGLNFELVVGFLTRRWVWVPLATIWVVTHFGVEIEADSYGLHHRLDTYFSKILCLLDHRGFIDQVFSLFPNFLERLAQIYIGKITHLHGC